MVKRLVRRTAPLPPIATDTGNNTPAKKLKKKTEAKAKLLPEYHRADHIPDLPKKDGPPPVENHTGSEILNDQSGSITVVLDRGAFRWLWEVTESRALQQWNQYGGMKMAAPFAGKRVVIAVREAGHKQYVTPHLLPGTSTSPGTGTGTSQTKPKLRKKPNPTEAT